MSVWPLEKLHINTWYMLTMHTIKGFCFASRLFSHNFFLSTFLREHGGPPQKSERFWMKIYSNYAGVESIVSRWLCIVNFESQLLHFYSAFSSVLNRSSLAYSVDRDETLNFLCRIWCKFHWKLKKFKCFKIVFLIFHGKEEALAAIPCLNCICFRNGLSRSDRRGKRSRSSISLPPSREKKSTNEKRNLFSHISCWSSKWMKVT